MKIVLFGLPFSPNVGDGIISECLAHAIADLHPETEVTRIDLSGRDGFGAVTVRNRALALRILQALPRPLRHAIVRNRLSALLSRVTPGWQAALEGADLAVIGGGQIFSDADLNFPIKISAAAALAQAANVPVAIHAVGVSQNWSRPGNAMFRSVLDADLRQIGLRDAPSLKAWTSQAGPAGPAPILTPDPGLLSASCYGPADQTSDRVALCVTDSGILDYHADAGTGAAEGLSFFAALAQDLIQRGREVTLFCNGAAEDRAALLALTELPDLAGAFADGRLRAAPSPDTPTDLARIISGQGCVVAHRLHACIIAYSYAIPSVGLGWDGKVESFFELTDRRAAFVPRAQCSAPHVADLVETALAEDINTEDHARVLDQTRRAIADLLALATTPPRARS